MRAVVLVGGFGTRLRPLTLATPKQLLPIGRLTMLERVIGQLGAHGITEAVLSLGFRPDRFLEAFGDGVCDGVRLRYAEEPEPLDTAGAIAFAAREAGIDEAFLAVNGDVLTDLDITGFVEDHHRLGGLATIALTPVEDPSRFGVVTTDAGGRVLGFVEKPPPGTATSNWINAGTYVLEPEVLDMVPVGARSSIERDVFPRLAEDGRLFAVRSDAYWLDAGTHAAYLDAHYDLMDGRRGAPESMVAASAEVDPSAEVTRSSVGPDAVIGAGARVENSVVMAGASIGARASVSDSIVAAGAVVGEAASVVNGSVVGFDAELAAGQVLDAATLPDPQSWS